MRAAQCLFSFGNCITKIVQLEWVMGLPTKWHDDPPENDEATWSNASLFNRFKVSSEGAIAPENHVREL